MRVFVLGALAAGFTAGCAATAQTAQEPVILPGLLNLEVVVGAVSTECPDLSVHGLDFEARGPRACVESAIGDINRLADTYMEALWLEGWAMVGGAGPQFWIERATDAEKCERVDLTALPGELVGLEEDRAILMFEHHPDQSCLKSAQ